MRCKRGAVLAAALAASAAGAAEIGYMEIFGVPEYGAPHVRARSYPVPKDFVDGQWHGIVSASDGRTYFSVSSHSPDHSAQFYRFDPSRAKPRVEHLIDLAAWCGEEVSIGRWNAQGKIHSQLFEADGKLYGSTTPAHRAPDHPYRGGHFLAYDLATGAYEDLGVFPGPGGGLLTMLHEPVRNRLYAIAQGKQTLCYYDLATGEIVTIGSCQENPMQTRTMISDERGNVYGCDWGHRVWRYLPDVNRVEVLPTLLPTDPDAPQPDPKARGHLPWKSTQWKNMVWDPETKWWYGVKGNDEYLFRFRPPPEGSSEARVEGLAPFGYRPSSEQPRFASLALVRRGRELFYCSYRMGRHTAHLMRYGIDTGKVDDLGPIVMDRRHLRTSEIHTMSLGSDNKLHAVAMVFTREGSRDPAKPWANRGRAYFHARFLVIDPDRDLEPGSGARRRPGIEPVHREVSPGCTVDVYAPPGRPEGERRPALVLFHGGGAGYPGQLAPHARHFAGKGLVGVTVGYRLTRRDGVRMPDGVADAKAAVRYVRAHAEEFGVDPARIAVAGESAGGHLAGCVGLVPGFEPENAAVSSRADALVLYNPVIDTASEDGWRMGGYTPAQRRALSPAHNVRPGAPPTVVIHGDKDTVTPFRWSERFVAAMKAAGNDAELERLEGVGHAFLVPGYGRHAEMDDAVRRTEAFLRRIGYLPPG